MNFSVLFVTRSAEIASMIGKDGDRLLDRSLVAQALKSGVRVTTRAIVVNAQASADLAREVFIAQKDFEAGILIVDEELVGLGRAIFPAMLFIPLDPKVSNGNLQNGIRRHLSLAVKCVLRMSAFTHESSFKILSLPFYNFSAPEIDMLRESLTSGIRNLGFILDIERFVRKMRDRQSPKTQTKYRNTYFVDDGSRFYEPSTEKHARADTVCPPHTFVCILRSKFRFGHKLDDHRHYNVSMEKDFIKGVFVDCHQDPKIVKPQSHLNMFPNDFF